MSTRKFKVRVSIREMDRQPGKDQREGFDQTVEIWARSFTDALARGTEGVDLVTAAMDTEVSEDA